MEFTYDAFSMVTFNPSCSLRLYGARWILTDFARNPCIRFHQNPLSLLDYLTVQQTLKSGVFAIKRGNQNSSWDMVRFLIHSATIRSYMVQTHCFP